MAKSSVDLKDLYDEPACSRNNIKDATCEKPKPGDSSSKCAFTGAQFALYPFADCAHIVHSPSTCQNIPFDNSNLIKNSWDGTDYKSMVFCTDMCMNDIVFGSDKRLRESVNYVFDEHKPKGIFLYTTCVSALIGEDVSAIARDKEEELGIPVIAVHSPGFVGNDFFGAKVAGISVLEELIGKKEPESTTEYDVNLIGEYNSLGDMWEYESLLGRLGVRVLARFSGDGRIENVMTAHRAKLNIVVSSRSLVTMARRMKERWGMPWVNVSFYGKRDISDALRAIAESFKDPLMARKAEQIIAEEERNIDVKLAEIKPILANKKAILNVDGTAIWKYISLLKDSGITILATSVDKANDDDTEKAESYLGNKSVLFMKNPDSDQTHIIDMFGADVLIGEAQSMYTAVKNSLAFVDVGRLSKTSYAGYDGVVKFANDIFDSVSNPVFEIVAKKAPWEA